MSTHLLATPKRRKQKQKKQKSCCKGACASLLIFLLSVPWVGIRDISSNGDGKQTSDKNLGQSVATATDG
eukprot:12894902-Prorocentrum_lima.AAC.1